MALYGQGVQLRVPPDLRPSQQTVLAMEPFLSPLGKEANGQPCPAVEGSLQSLLTREPIFQHSSERLSSQELCPLISMTSVPTQPGILNSNAGHAQSSDYGTMNGG